MLCDWTFLLFSVMFNLVQVVWPLAELCCARACAVTQYFPAKLKRQQRLHQLLETNLAYLSLLSQQQLCVNMDIQTIDTENDVLSVRPLQEALLKKKVMNSKESEQNFTCQSWS